MEEPSMLLILISLCTTALFMVACFNQAKKKSRNEIGWAAAGLFFGFFALLTILLLPKKTKDVKAPVKEAASPVMESKASEAFAGDEPFDLPRAPRISGSKALDWYFIDSTEDNTIKGPLSVDDLRKELHAKTLNGETYIWCEEFEDWTLISEFSNASLLLDPDFIE